MSDTEFYKGRISELEREISFARQQINNQMSKQQEELRQHTWEMYLKLNDGNTEERFQLEDLVLAAKLARLFADNYSEVEK